MSLRHLSRVKISKAYLSQSFYKKVSIFLTFCFTYCNICYGEIDSNKYLTCFANAAHYYKVPQEILIAIAYVESRYNPNAYNENNNSSHDIGLMQINSTWLLKLKAFNVTEDMLYDPCQSIYIGAWILANNIKSYGLNWTAIQRYNGRDIELKYATKVYERIQQTYPEIFSQVGAKVIPMEQGKAIDKPILIKKVDNNISTNVIANSKENLVRNNISANSIAQTKQVKNSSAINGQEIDSIVQKSIATPQVKESKLSYENRINKLLNAGNTLSSNKQNNTNRIAVKTELNKINTEKIVTKSDNKVIENNTKAVPNIDRKVANIIIKKKQNLVPVATTNFREFYNKYYSKNNRVDINKLLNIIPKKEINKISNKSNLHSILNTQKKQNKINKKHIKIKKQYKKEQTDINRKSSMLII